MRTSHTESSTFTLRLFGHFDLKINGVSVAPLPSRKAQVLLALLVLRHDRWQERVKLAAELWPDSESEDSKVNFRQQLSRLRLALGDEKWRIKEHDHALQLDVTAAFVDVLAFKTISVAQNRPERRPI